MKQLYFASFLLTFSHVGMLVGQGVQTPIFVLHDPSVAGGNIQIDMSAPANSCFTVLARVEFMARTEFAPVNVSGWVNGDRNLQAPCMIEGRSSIKFSLAGHPGGWYRVHLSGVGIAKTINILLGGKLSPPSETIVPGLSEKPTQLDIDFNRLVNLFLQPAGLLSGPGAQEFYLGPEESLAGDDTSYSYTVYQERPDGLHALTLQRQEGGYPGSVCEVTLSVPILSEAGAANIDGTTVVYVDVMESPSMTAAIESFGPDDSPGMSFSQILRMPWGPDVPQCSSATATGPTGENAKISHKSPSVSARDIFRLLRLRR